MPPEKAKIFMNGRSQAVRLPKKYRFDTDEVFISQQGENIVISAKKPDWDDFFDTQSVFDDDYLGERMDDRPQEREF